MTTAEQTYTICPACTGPDPDHTDCTLGARGGKEACGCDHTDHPDYGRRALHTRNHPTPDLGHPRPATPDGAAPFTADPAVQLKPPRTTTPATVEPAAPTVEVLEPDGVPVIVEDPINTGTTPAEGGAAEDEG